MDAAEAREQLRAMAELVLSYDKDHRFTARDICDMHEKWLGGIYEWAGTYRHLNISKAGFLFAAAGHVPRLMAAFEKDVLRKHTPCVFASTDRIIEALAVVHTELVLIHPFREGNGRLAGCYHCSWHSRQGSHHLILALSGEKRRRNILPRSRQGLTATMNR